MGNEDYKILEKEKLLKLAELGISEAQDEYGYRLLQESNVGDEKLAEAKKWFTLAAEQGNPVSMFNLATMYKMGLGCDLDYDKAFQLYTQSADLGLAVSKYYLSEMYKFGQGTEKDEQRALELVTESFRETSLVTN